MKPEFKMESDTAYTRVRALILSRELPAGTSVSERGLSETLGLGRTPVREAIKTLAQEGLLEVIPARGTFVRQLTVEDLREIHEVRLGLEGIAAVLAAQHGASEDLRQCAQQLREMAQQTGLDVVATQKVGWRFHEAMFLTTGNQRLLSLYLNLRAQSGLALQQLDHYDAGRLRLAINEHLEIYAAIEARDAVRAQRAVWDHLSHALQGRLQSLAPNPGRPAAPL